MSDYVQVAAHLGVGEVAEERLAFLLAIARREDLWYGRGPSAGKALLWLLKKAMREEREAQLIEAVE